MNTLIKVTEKQQPDTQGGCSGQQQAANKGSTKGTKDQTSSVQSGKVIKVTYLSERSDEKYKDRKVKIAQDKGSQTDTAATR